MSISVIVLFLNSGYNRMSVIMSRANLKLPAPINTIFATKNPPEYFVKCGIYEVNYTPEGINSQVKYVSN